MQKDREDDDDDEEEEKEEAEKNETEAFVSCFELLPEDRLTHAVFQPSGREKKGK